MTDNTKIIAPINAQQEIELFNLGDLQGVEAALKQQDVVLLL